APLQDAVDLVIATDEEKSQLAEWKKYRVLVNRVDTSNPDWPDVPVSQSYDVVKNQADVNKNTPA
ncbi:TPA: tail fiber assembly protein, partial [Salmonella enterica]